MSSSSGHSLLNRQTGSGMVAAVKEYHGIIDLKELNEKGWTVLFHVMSLPLSEVELLRLLEALKSHPKVVVEEMGFGGRPSTEDEVFPIHLAIEKQYHGVVLFLIDANPRSAHFHTRDKRTTLHFAAEFGDMDVVRRLLDMGEDPTALTLDGSSAAHFAGRGRQEEILLELLCEGCNPLLENQRAETPFGNFFHERIRQRMHSFDPADRMIVKIQKIYHVDVDTAGEILDTMTEVRPDDWSLSAFFVHEVIRARGMEKEN